VVIGGGLVSALALGAAWIGLPLARRWSDREAAIAARRAELSQLQRLVADEPAIRRILALRRAQRAGLREQLLTGATPALAASDLQALLQRYADSSRVTLDRVDLAAQPEAARGAGLPAIPVELSASGDIYGLAELIARLQNGSKLLVIDEIQVNAGTVGDERAPLLTWSMRLHGSYSAD